MSEKKEKFAFRQLPSLLKETGIAWNDNNPWRLSAVVAYYAILSLPGLLVIIVNTVGAIWGHDIVTGRLTGQISQVLGSDAADAIKGIIEGTQGGNKSLISTIIGIATLLFGATGVFFHLQISLNQIWHIKPNPNSEFKKFLKDRLLSFAFILIIGFLLLISFLITAAMSFLSGYIESILPEAMVYLAFAVNMVLSLGIITVLFALIYRYLPDAKISWKTVWIGALITALLFTLGKFLLGIYFSKASPGSTYGAAGSVILILLWVSYSCLTLFFGAEFTYVYAKRYALGVQPAAHAMHVQEREVILKKGSDDEADDADKKKEDAEDT